MSDPTSPPSVTEIGFGGGCHWCTEAVFAALRGVHRVDQGFVRSDPPNDTWSEAVIVAYDPDKVPLDVLTDIHLRTHASTSNHKMRGKYRSAIYVTTDGQADSARAILTELQSGFDKRLVTQILPNRGFRASDPRFQRYYEQQAGGPFCTRFIDPKLDLLRRDYARFVQPQVQGTP